MRNPIIFKYKYLKKLVQSILLIYSLPTFALKDSEQTHCWGFFKPLCQRFNNIWNQGYNELYISGYAWHNRWTYSDEKIRKYNELAWGGGLGKGLFDEYGNWQGIYGFAFLDSHKQLEPALGYAYLKVATINQDIKAGLGYTVLITSRSDINNNIPFPGALPWASIFVHKVTLAATYIPGFSHNGNVLYVLVKYAF